MTIKLVNAFRDSAGGIHETMRDAQMAEVTRIMRTHTSGHNGVNFTRPMAEKLVDDFHEIVCALFGNEARIIDGDQIEAFKAVMAETQPTQTVRLQKALHALGFEYGDEQELPETWREKERIAALREFRDEEVASDKSEPGLLCSGPYYDGYSEACKQMINALNRKIDEQTGGQNHA